VPVKDTTRAVNKVSKGKGKQKINMNNIIRFALVLFLVNLVAASILASVYYVTKVKIEAQERLVREEALKEVLPESAGDRLEPVEKNSEVKYWKAFKGQDNRASGYVFIAKKYGYSSVIETMVGIKDDGTITGVRILSQSETPGLGAKIVEVISDETILKAIREAFLKKRKVEKKLAPYFTEQFKGMDIKKVDLSNNEIDVITGATISSRAVIDSIREKGLEILNAER
jgi:electron transport complex protein RnfG